MTNSNIVISVKNISKRYRLGTHEKADTFAGHIKNAITYPLRNLRRIMRLSSFKDGEDDTIFWALKDISFEVKKGEVLGIIGHNGAGKSTLLKILSRITPPSGGEIEIKGRVSSLLEVGTGFHPELSGRDNIYMNGTILGMTKREIDSKLDEIIDFAGVHKHIDTPVKFYSSGMKVRLGFSVAAHLEPEILIIDEVLAVGDAEFQKKCLGKMEDISGQGRTVLFVSHNMNAVKSLCPKALLLKNGNLVFKGESEAVVDRYLSINKIGDSKYLFDEEGDLKEDFIKINSLQIHSEDHNLTNHFPMDKNILILLEFEFLQKPSNDFGFTLQFKNERGDILFVTSSRNIQFQKFNTGNHKIQCTIPSPFFNEGEFSVNFHIVKFGMETRLLKKYIDVVFFRIGPPNQKLGEWMGKSKGWLKPQFNWEEISEDANY
ncbi:ABC transporter ATP-binding protein [Hyphobacterium sp. CCMP332]|nr:ABC transporter ATP-binding protein [Hyphobacterium sp. CCMP332]